MKKISILAAFCALFTQSLFGIRIKEIFLDKPATFLGKSSEILGYEVIAVDASGMPLLPNGTPAKPCITLLNTGNSFYDASGVQHRLIQDFNGNWIPPLLGRKGSFLTKTHGNEAAYVVVISAYIGALVGFGIGVNKLILLVQDTIKQRKIARIKELIIKDRLTYFIVKSEVLKNLKSEYDSALNEEIRDNKLNKLAELILNNKQIASLINLSI